MSQNAARYYNVNKKFSMILFLKSFMLFFLYPSTFFLKNLNQAIRSKHLGFKVKTCRMGEGLKIVFTELIAILF